MKKTNKHHSEQIFKMLAMIMCLALFLVQLAACQKRAVSDEQPEKAELEDQLIDEYATEFDLTVLDENGEPYSDYTLVIDRFYDVKSGKIDEEYHYESIIDSDTPQSIILPEGVYRLTVTDNQDAHRPELSITIKVVELCENNKLTLTMTSAPIEDSADIKDTENIFEQLPEGFYMGSGVGAWGTFITINADGTFEGQYHDADAGDAGDEYPNGTLHICDFSGKFSAPVKIDDHTYSMEIEYLNSEGTPGVEYYEDGIRYIYSRPYGLDSSLDFYIYLPGKPVPELPENVINWSFRSGTGTIPEDTYVLYNDGDFGCFVGTID